MGIHEAQVPWMLPEGIHEAQPGGSLALTGRR